ncbi:MAG: nucleotide sugar dehydrogenase [Candidatus Melainabacteria bacterium]
MNTITTQTTGGQAQLLERIETGSARVAVIGMGYVGLPLAMCITKIGFSVWGFDINPERVHDLNEGNSYIDDVASAEIQAAIAQGRFAAFTDFDRLGEADVIIICVPTPLTKNRDPDTSYISRTADILAAHLRPGQLITLESTTYPGTTEEILLPALNRTGLRVGEDYFLAHSPERVDPGNQRYTTHNTNKIVGGFTPACLEVATTFYQKSILHVIPVSSPGCAEMVKVFENTFRAVNIALVNELALLCDKMGLNVWEVVEAAGTKPFGMMSFYPGPGVGGHCIPVDPFYLTWKAREYNFHTRFIELAGEINSYMPEFVREKLIRALGLHGKPLYHSKVLLIGISYKKDIGDWRESPGIELIRLLDRDGVNLTYHDPYVAAVSTEETGPMMSVALDAETLAEADCAIILTDHACFDYEAITAHSRVVIDTRNACKHLKQNRHKVVLL